MIKIKITCLPCSKNIEIKAKTLSIKFICVVKKSAVGSPKKSRFQKGYVIPGCRLARWDKSKITTPPPGAVYDRFPYDECSPIFGGFHNLFTDFTQNIDI